MYPPMILLGQLVNNPTLITENLVLSSLGIPFGGGTSLKPLAPDVSPRERKFNLVMKSLLQTSKYHEDKHSSLYPEHLVQRERKREEHES